MGQLCKEIEELLNKKKVQGSTIPSKANWLESGERMSKYFFILEKHNYNRKSINWIWFSNDLIATDPNRILDEQSKFYQEVYTTQKLILMTNV